MYPAQFYQKKMQLSLPSPLLCALRGRLCEQSPSQDVSLTLFHQKNYSMHLV